MAGDYIRCLATDYDGTLARDGLVDDATPDALAFRRSGRRLLLVTGRELPDLVRVFPRIDLFDRVVVENGALLFEPATKKESPPSSRTPAGARGDIAQEGRHAAFCWAIHCRDLRAKRKAGSRSHP